MTLHIISYGGGVQSTALLVLAAQQKIPHRIAVMANVGDDSEHPATLQFVREVAMPWAAERGVAVHLVDRVKRDGSVETLYGRLMREGSRSLPIPVRMNDTGAPGTRSCTADFKIKVLEKWCRQHGATASDPAECAVGISLDEFQRMRDSRCAYQRLAYPLVEMRLTREDCKRIIAEAGLPVPPKSSCYFCPFHDLKAWERLYAEDRDLFEKSADLEATLNQRRAMLGRDPVWLTRFRRPLREVVTGDHLNQLPLLPVESHSCGPFVCDADGGGKGVGK